MPNAPIAFFAYNRPEHTRKALESLAMSKGAAESELFIFCDGPKNAASEKAVGDVRFLVKSRKWCKTVHIVEREENWGLAKSLIYGVTELANNFGRVIVLEDDLVLSSWFLDYMNRALEIYQDIPRVMHISGYLLPVKGQLPETFFYRNTSCWGWATWKRAWDMFEPDTKKLLAGFNNLNQRREFDVRGTMGFYRMLRDQDKGRIDSWAIRWYASVFLNNGLCLYPGKSLVNNIGHDNSGVHCGASTRFECQVSQDRVLNFTQDIHENKQAVKLMADFYRSLKEPFLVRVYKKIKRRFNG